LLGRKQLPKADTQRLRVVGLRLHGHLQVAAVNTARGRRTAYQVAAPWAPPVVTNPQATAQYVAAAGLPCSEEMLQVHYHAHLDINVNGSPVVVPQYLGFVAQGNQVVGLAPLHTHDSSGIIHIENSVPATFYLGQFFIEWGVRFTKTCIGPYCAGKGKELAVFVDGNRYTGDPTQLVLKKHQEIAIEYGPTGKLPAPPSSYAFPNGL
jgi:hypothetical protein